MATVQLSNIINKTVFMDLKSEHRPELTALFTSGVVVRDPLADALCAADGLDGTLPFWADLDPTVEPNYSSDLATTSTPKNISQNSQKTRKAFLNDSWSAMDLAREVQMGVDAMQHIRNRLDEFWVRQWQRRVIATIRGILANNIASDAGDMIYDISIQTTTGLAASNYFSRAAFTTALYTMGDHASNLAAIVVHSVVMKRMVDNEDIDYILDSEGKASIPTYMGLRVIVDDSSPTIAGTGSPASVRYVSTIFGKAAFAYGEAMPLHAIEVQRYPDKGHGGGEEVLHSRKTWLIHPLGHSNDNATASAGNGKTQNLADLALAINWSRTHYRKNVPMAFLITNG